MNSKTTTPNHVQALTPEQKQELRGLLATHPLTASQNLFLRGQTVEAIVSVWPSEENEGCFDAMLSVFAPGKTRLRMDGMSVSAHAKTPGDELLRVGQLTRRGDISLPDLPVDVPYHLYLRETIVTSAVSFQIWQRPEAERDALAAASSTIKESASFPLAAASQEEQTHEVDLASLLAESHVIASADGKVRATLRRTDQETTVVAVETNERSLADTVVALRFVAASGRVCHSEEVILQAVEDLEGLWEGRWEGRLQLAEPCRLVIEVLDERRPHQGRA